ncbi:MAG: transglycosylase domain-containing protein, partial [Firmicutes bacterium]|nr:transglycosylase domain-containing protein [Bacillota bacterium]
RKKRRKRRPLRTLARVVAAVIAIGALGSIAFLIYMASVWNPDMPDQLVSRVHAIAAAHGGMVPLRKISPFLQEALIATEDRTFYSNIGIDPEAILRAAIVDLIHGRPVEGGSTITEQLMKDIFLTDKKTIQRKLKQIAYAIMISQSLPKRTILDLYLNEVYLGNGAYGVGSASRIYFGVTPARLTPAESAMIAGLPQAPTLYDPLHHFRAAKTRQWEVLQGMVEAGDLTMHRARQIYRAPLPLEGTLPRH